MISIGTTYNSYKKETNTTLTKTEYTSIVTMFFQFMFSKLLKGEIISLPDKLGNLLFRGKKHALTFKEDRITGLAPDWVATKKLWDSNSTAKEKKQLVYHKNLNTDGYIYSIRWDKHRSQLKNKAIYSFELCRKLKRLVSFKIKNENLRFTHI